MKHVRVFGEDTAAPNLSCVCSISLSARPLSPHRMPVILDRESYDLWLDPGMTITPNPHEKPILSLGNPSIPRRRSPRG
jgi:hypothetical protein